MHNKHMVYVARFEDCGGYDCMSDAWRVESENGEFVCTVDEADHGPVEAERIARTIAQRLSA